MTGDALFVGDVSWDTTLHAARMLSCLGDDLPSDAARHQLQSAGVAVEAVERPGGLCRAYPHRVEQLMNAVVKFRI